MGKLFDGARPLLPVSERDGLEKGLIKMKARREGKIPSLISAWPKFNDAFCDGLEWKTITVIGARPGIGKTLFAEQLVSDIIDRGVALCGGGALLRGVDKLLTKSLGIPAYLVDNPLTCVVQGTVKGFTMLNMIRRNLPQV